MTDESNVLGRIIVSPKAIATIASQSALQSYGVVGMASKNIVDGIAQALVRDPRHGVQVSTSDDQITIDLFIIVEYQTRVSSVAESVANIVHYQVEKSLGMPVKAVNVHVQGLRISSKA
ncbi:MAG: Asp23/Gls24 family envelope stress response protein [Anaerolineales bacterium]|nr:MAG: Asp23/Gls24 family envelope stress response protein [Anaerolineales bacterium]